MLKDNRRLAATLLLVLGVSVAAPACAARIYSTRTPAYQGFDRRPYDNGYSRGFDRGRDDRRRGLYDSHGRNNNIRDFGEFRDFRDADAGYRRGDGDRDTYRDMFRRGFRAGYAEAFGARNDRDQRR